MGTGTSWDQGVRAVPLKPCLAYLSLTQKARPSPPQKARAELEAAHSWKRLLKTVHWARQKQDLARAQETLQSVWESWQSLVGLNRAVMRSVLKAIKLPGPHYEVEGPEYQ